MNPDIPIMLGAENEATVKLCAELCDGWLPLGLCARFDAALSAMARDRLSPRG